MNASLAVNHSPRPILVRHGSASAVAPVRLDREVGRPHSAPPVLGLDRAPTPSAPVTAPGDVPSPSRAATADVAIAQHSLQTRIRALMTSPTVSGLACATLAGVCSGGSTPLVATATAIGGPIAASALMTAGTAAVAVVALPLPQRGMNLWPMTPRMGLQLAGTTVFSAVLAPDALLVAYRTTSAASVALAMNLEPFLTTALEWPFFRQRPSKHVMLACMATLASGGLCAAGQLTASPGSGEGIGFAVAAAAAFAAGNLCIGGLSDRKPQHIVSSTSILGAGISALVSGAMRETFPTGKEAGTIFGCGVLLGAAACFLTMAVQRVGVGRTALFFSVVDLTVGVSASCAAGQGTMTALIGASLGVALLGAVVLGHEAMTPAKRATDEEAGAVQAVDGDAQEAIGGDVQGDIELQDTPHRNAA